jgi:hypothetical protein
LSADLASVRYRALIPMFALDRTGSRSMVFTHAAPPPIGDLDAIVFVKHFQPECYRIAQEARRMGKAVILDLCDNIFIDAYGKQKRTRPADLFLSMATQADAIVVTTEPLAVVVRAHVGEALPIAIVPDGIDDAQSRSYAARELARAQHRQVHHKSFGERVRAYLTRPDALQATALLSAARAFGRIYLGLPERSDEPRQGGSDRR